MPPLRLAVIFGSRSVEHEVSIITAQQIMAAADPEKYEIVPVYITKQGDWLTGAALRDLATFQEPERLERLERAYIPPVPSLPGLIRVEGGGLNFLRRTAVPPIDVVLPAVHGTYGEDGTLQGLLELAGLPYVGAGVAAAAIGMDKILMKAAFQAAGLPTVESRWYTRVAYESQPDAVVADVEAALGFPAFVKPAVLGSSIGVALVRNQADLRFALEVAFSYGRRVLVERALDPVIEVNCAVLGNDEPVPSVCEQPVAAEGVLSFADKYLRGTKRDSAAAGERQGDGQPPPAAASAKAGMQSAQRLIPAPISDELTHQIQTLAVAAFRAIDGAGLARVDFLLTPDRQRVYVNEINTLPGSLSFYLWEPAGIPFPTLIDRLVALAQERHRDRGRTTYSYDTDLLERVGKGSKGG